MKQETKRLTSIIIAGGIIAISLVIYFDLIVPSYTSLQNLKGEVQSESALLANETQIVGQAKSVLSSYQSEASSTQAVQLALPTGPDVSGALAQIYGIASNAGVNIQQSSISVQAVAVPNAQSTASTASGQIASAAAAGSIVKPVGTVSFQVSGTGTYEAFKAFLQGLETNIRIFDTTMASLQPGAIIGAKTPAGTQNLFNFSVTVVTYYQSL